MENNNADLFKKGFHTSDLLPSSVTPPHSESEVKVAQSCPTLCDPVDYTVHGILQVRILEWVAYPFSGGTSRHRNWTGVSCIAGGFFTNWAIREGTVQIWRREISLSWINQVNSPIGRKENPLKKNLRQRETQPIQRQSSALGPQPAACESNAQGAG